ncbi:hypothetical protein BJ742DRAFT_858356, partial [Cladochytrium replicatum]
MYILHSHFSGCWKVPLVFVGMTVHCLPSQIPPEFYARVENLYRDCGYPVPENIERLNQNKESGRVSVVPTIEVTISVNGQDIQQPTAQSKLIDTRQGNFLTAILTASDAHRAMLYGCVAQMIESFCSGTEKSTGKLDDLYCSLLWIQQSYPHHPLSSSEWLYSRIRLFSSVRSAFLLLVSPTPQTHPVESPPVMKHYVRGSSDPDDAERSDEEDAIISSIHHSQNIRTPVDVSECYRLILRLESTILAEFENPMDVIITMLEDTRSWIIKAEKLSNELISAMITYSNEHWQQKTLAEKSEVSPDHPDDIGETNIMGSTFSYDDEFLKERQVAFFDGLREKSYDEMVNMLLDAPMKSDISRRHKHQLAKLLASFTTLNETYGMILLHCHRLVDRIKWFRRLKKQKDAAKPDDPTPWKQLEEMAQPDPKQPNTRHKLTIITSPKNDEHEQHKGTENLQEKLSWWLRFLAQHITHSPPSISMLEECRKLILEVRNFAVPLIIGVNESADRLLRVIQAARAHQIKDLHIDAPPIALTKFQTSHVLKLLQRKAIEEARYPTGVITDREEDTDNTKFSATTALLPSATAEYSPAKGGPKGKLVPPSEPPIEEILARIDKTWIQVDTIVDRVVAAGSQGGNPYDVGILQFVELLAENLHRTETQWWGIDRQKYLSRPTRNTAMSPVFPTSPILLSPMKRSLLSKGDEDRTLTALPTDNTTAGDGDPEIWRDGPEKVQFEPAIKLEHNQIIRYTTGFMQIGDGASRKPLLSQKAAGQPAGNGGAEKIRNEMKVVEELSEQHDLIHRAQNLFRKMSARKVVPEEVQSDRAADTSPKAQRATTVVCFLAIFTRDEVYKFYPFNEEEIRGMVRAVQAVTGLNPFQSDEYVKSVLTKKMEYARRTILNTLLKESGNPWIEHSGHLMRIIKSLTAEHSAQRLPDLERLYHSCRMEAEVTKEAVYQLRRIWHTTQSEETKLKVLSVFDRLLDKSVMREGDAVFMTAFRWLKLLEDTVSPYKSADALKIVVSLVKRAKTIQVEPLMSSAISQCYGQFDNWEDFAFLLTFYDPTESSTNPMRLNPAYI